MRPLSILFLALVLVATALPALAQQRDFGDRIEDRYDRRGDRIEQRLDRRGDRIEARYDRRADCARNNGYDRRADKLERQGNRIDRRLDRRGNRIDRRMDRKGARMDRRIDRRTDRSSLKPALNRRMFAHMPGVLVADAGDLRFKLVIRDK